MLPKRQQKIIRLQENNGNHFRVKNPKQIGTRPASFFVNDDNFVRRPKWNKNKKLLRISSLNYTIITLSKQYLNLIPKFYSEMCSRLFPDAHEGWVARGEGPNIFARGDIARPSTFCPTYATAPGRALARAAENTSSASLLSTRPRIYYTRRTIQS